MSFSLPAPLTAEHDLDRFECGNASIETWLRGQALKNEVKGFSRTFVTLDETGEVAGFYTLSSFAVERRLAGKDGTGGPSPIPAILLGKLAVHRDHQGRGLGFSLLQHAVVQAVRAGEIAAARVMFVHAADEEAVTFYRKFGFRPVNGEALSLIAAIDDLRESIIEAQHGA
ncbi:GNAT family N-acetyltransferase [Agrococcus sp. Ld7]|uniref:GNAT family N-acetyltransferase n=1 Tax=Agrococcus sp. Ld7 TaxID=649148 RepID=UPI0038653E26